MRSSPSRDTADNRPTGTARVVVSSLAVALTLVAAGCQSADPKPTPSQDRPRSPATAEPEPSPSQYDPVTAAKAAYENYNDVQNAVAQDYFRGWDGIVLPLLTGVFTENRRQISQEYGEGQYYQIGEDKILNYDVTSSNEREVIMDVCIDGSSVHIIGPDGAPAFDGSIEPRLSEVTVKRVEVEIGTDRESQSDISDPLGQEWWRVADSVRQVGETCSG